MRFYTQSFIHTCGIDLHGRSIYVCVLDRAGEKLVHRRLRCDGEKLLEVLVPFRGDLVVGVESTFNWYWLADLCDAAEIPFALGHAQYMKAVHGAKVGNDRVDSYRIAALLRGGTFPQAYVYPREMRATRDLLRRRSFFVRKRAELYAHIQNSNLQYNLPPIGKVARAETRERLRDRFPVPDLQLSVDADLELIAAYDGVIARLEKHLKKRVRVHDRATFEMLQTVPGVGTTLALTLLYEIHEIERFPRVQDFVSYARLIRPVNTSAGKPKGSGRAKIGNPHLRWAFAEAAALFLRGNEEGQKLLARLEKRHGKGKALSVLAAKLGRATYFMMRRRSVFDRERFLAA